MPGRSTGTPPLNGRLRPAGVGRGVAAYVAAWLGGAVIAMLTGASAVVIVLAAAAIGGLAAFVAAPLRLRRATAVAVDVPAVATTGDTLRLTLAVRSPWPVLAAVLLDGETVAEAWVHDGEAALEGEAPRRGIYTAATIRLSSAGRLGVVWWQRTATVLIGPLAVAPMAAATGAPVTATPHEAGTAGVVGGRPGRDDIEAVRPWRDGDEAAAIHWTSTLRAGELIVRQRRSEQDTAVVVAAATGTGDPDGEAARVRRAVEDAWARGAAVSIAVDGDPPWPVVDGDHLLRWSAAFDPLPLARGLPWWRRPLGGQQVEPAAPLATRARVAVGVASFVPMAMLLRPLGYGWAAVLLVAAGVAFGAALTAATSLSKPVRQFAGMGVGIALFVSLADLGAVDSIVAALRFVMPQILVALCVMQGYECTDRRAARVTLAVAGLLTAYAAGVRVDQALGGWLVVAGVAIAIASQEIARPDRVRAATPARVERAAPDGESRRRWATGVAGLGAAAVATVALLAVVPIPRGPAQLTLPSWLESRRWATGDGSLATPGGSPLLGGAVQGDRRDGAGAGGYPGFSNELDTGLRGDLGDAVVLRVRAPFADYWRGQTFTRFDGRTWYVDEETGVYSDGPDHVLGPAIGDVESGFDDEFIQTFYAEVDLPNIVFAANTPTRVLLDAPLWRRRDGALRAGVVLPAGSAYTVVSRRSGATTDGLRGDGDVSATISPAEFLDLPASTTDRTRALARRLAAGSSSTYDTILRIQRWLAANVEYDLDAPVPPDGADAVDHFLFESRRGFCEQIATATAVLLRSLGIPARIATGYVPSERDEVAGVWISRASDAHAWVEVRFPSFGWVAFDPTASVPLSGEAGEATIGGDLVKALAAFFGGHVGELVLAGLGGGAVVVGTRLLRRLAARRRRGRWGLLQDRFTAVAVRQGAPPGAANADLALAFDDPAAAALAAEVAADLDASAFAAHWDDDDTRYHRDAAHVALLEHVTTG